jgi:D-methionine transport system substrate-binding protein
MEILMRKTPAALAVLTVVLLAACGSGSDDATSDAATDTAAALSEPLKVGASPVPHAEILKFVQDELAGDTGLKLEIVEFTDYIQPNVALAEKQIDANYFQTVPYLEEQSTAAGYDFTAVTKVHLEPLGLYSSSLKDVADLPDGAEIAIPNDPTNGGRALDLLAANGLLTLADTGATSPSARDITDNPKNLKITEIEAAQLPRSLQDVDAAVINGNYAIDAGLKPAEDALVLEEAEDNPNVNVLVVRAGDEDDPRVQALAQLLTSDEVRTFIEDTYQGAVIPAF